MFMHVVLQVHGAVKDTGVKEKLHYSFVLG